MLQRGIPIEELRKNPKYADVLEDPYEMRFGGQIEKHQDANGNMPIVYGYALKKPNKIQDSVRYSD